MLVGQVNPFGVYFDLRGRAVKLCTGSLSAAATIANKAGKHAKRLKEKSEREKLVVNGELWVCVWHFLSGVCMPRGTMSL
jgi:hypothetical protein